MEFEAYPPLLPTEILGNAWHIFASGEIQQHTPMMFEDLLEEKTIPSDSIVYFDSQGGNLLAGMDLGRIIRRKNLNTYIGAKGEVEDFGPDIGKLYRSKPGNCASACALAFLGGVFRYRNGGSYGVHRFHNERSIDADMAQITSAVILNYVRDMGVDQDLFGEMTRASSSDINVLGEDRLLSLKVVNNGESETKWTLEAAGPHGLYLRGHRHTVFGEQKLIFMNASGDARLVMAAWFSPKGNDARIVEMSAISLLIDGETVAVPSARVVMKPTIIEGWANVLLVLDEPNIERVLRAGKVGIAAQYTHGAPFFLGIGEMDFSGGRTKLAALLASGSQTR